MTNQAPSHRSSECTPPRAKTQNYVDAFRDIHDRTERRQRRRRIFARTDEPPVIRCTELPVSIPTHPAGCVQPVLLTGERMLWHEPRKPGTLPFGQLVATPGAMTAMGEAGHIPPEFLLRHENGDWGVLDNQDKAENEQSLVQGWRLLSAYDTRLHERLWTITEAEPREITTILTGGLLKEKRRKRHEDFIHRLYCGHYHRPGKGSQAVCAYAWLAA